MRDSREDPVERASERESESGGSNPKQRVLAGIPHQTKVWTKILISQAEITGFGKPSMNRYYIYLPVIYPLTEWERSKTERWMMRLKGKRDTCRIESLERNNRNSQSNRIKQAGDENQSRQEGTSEEQKIRSEVRMANWVWRGKTAEEQVRRNNRTEEEVMNLNRRLGRSVGNRRSEVRSLDFGEWVRASKERKR